MKKPLKWIPVDCHGWIFGSTRIELEVAQRAVFFDLLVLSAMDDGYIRANEDTPYPPIQLAGLLRIDVELLTQTIERCIAVNKITRLPNGTLYITNYKKYQLSRMQQWRLTHPEPPKEDKTKIEKSRGEESIEGYENVTPRYKDVTSPPPNGDGLLPSPDQTPFKMKDALVEERADIRRRQRLLDEGKTSDSEGRISQQGVDKAKARFNQHIKDLQE